MAKVTNNTSSDQKEEFDPVFGNNVNTTNKVDDIVAPIQETKTEVDPNQALKDQIRAEIEAEMRAEAEAKEEADRLKAIEDEKNRWYEISIKGDSYKARGDKYAFTKDQPRYTQNKELVAEYEMNSNFIVKPVTEEFVTERSPASIRKAMQEKAMIQE